MSKQITDETDARELAAKEVKEKAARDAKERFDKHSADAKIRAEFQAKHLAAAKELAAKDTEQRHKIIQAQVAGTLPPAPPATFNSYSCTHYLTLHSFYTVFMVATQERAALAVQAAATKAQAATVENERKEHLAQAAERQVSCR